MTTKVDRFIAGLLRRAEGLWDKGLTDLAEAYVRLAKATSDHYRAS